MTDFDLDLERAPRPRNGQRPRGHAARLAEHLAYCDDPQDRDLWVQVRREVAAIYERLG